MRKVLVWLMVGLAAFVCGAWNAHAETENTKPVTAGALSLDGLMDRVETRYAGPGFSVKFFQTSTLKAMNIKDSATGSMFVKRPGMMRWEYETPSPQVIITDGNDLWIHRPEDNQVMHGAAPAFFGGGKGAGFLSDMSRIREDFDVTLDSPDQPGDYKVKLIPKKNTFDVSAIYLTVSGITFEVTALVTLNAYEDETRFELIDYRFGQALAASLFQFTIPEGAEVLTLEQ